MHLSSDGSDSENLEETNKDTPSIEDLQLLAGMIQTESGANLPGTPASPDLTMPTSHPNKDTGAGEGTIPTREEERDMEQTPAQPAALVTKLATPDSTEAVKPQLQGWTQHLPAWFHPGLQHLPGFQHGP